MKSKKLSKKTLRKSSFTQFDALATTRAIIGLLIIMLGAAIFLLFRTYEENIIMNNMFYPFMILTFLGMGLLVYLLFLINPAKAKRK